MELGTDMRKSINDHLDKIEKLTVEEMVLAEQNLQVELKKVLVAMETKRTDFDNIRQDVNKVKKYKIDSRLSCELWCNTQLAFLWNQI
jgi:secreted Zn-dependent insulinase-like peptidase